MRHAGFTLIELVVTVMIVAILAVGAMPVMQLTIKRNQEMELRTHLRQIRTAIDAYKKAFDEGKIKKTLEDSGYPPTLETLELGVQDQTAPKKKILRFIRRIPRDPMSSDKEASAIESWGKRSYLSEASSPSEGADVYDVYSLSPQKALDGTFYSTW
ncbi:MAG: type II secretion system protein [Methylophilaceae bacterium]